MTTVQTASNTMTDNLLIVYQYPPRGPVVVSVRVLRREGEQVVVRVTGGVENGHPEVWRIDSADLIETQDGTFLEGELIDCHRGPSRWLAMTLTGQVRIAGWPRPITVPMKSMAAA